MSELFPRRTLLQSVAALATVAVITERQASAEEKQNGSKCSPVQLGKPEVKEPSTVTAKHKSVTLSPDNQAATALFDNFTVEQGQQQAAKAFTPLKTAFLEIPLTKGTINSDCDLLGYTIDIRGFVNVSDGGHAALTVIANGEVDQFEVPFEQATDKSFFKRVILLSQSSGNPPETVVGRCLRIQLIAFVETAKPNDQAMLTIDSVDIVVRRA